MFFVCFCSCFREEDLDRALDLWSHSETKDWSLTEVMNERAGAVMSRSHSPDSQDHLFFRFLLHGTLKQDCGIPKLFPLEPHKRKRVVSRNSDLCIFSLRHWTAQVYIWRESPVESQEVGGGRYVLRSMQETSRRINSSFPNYSAQRLSGQPGKGSLEGLHTGLQPSLELPRYVLKSAPYVEHGKRLKK